MGKAQPQPTWPQQVPQAPTYTAGGTGSFPGSPAQSPQAGQAAGGDDGYLESVLASLQPQQLSLLPAWRPRVNMAPIFPRKV